MVENGFKETEITAGHGRGRVHGNGCQENADTDTWTTITDLVSDYTPTTTSFNEKFGPQIALTHNASPLDFFSLFFDDAILKMLIDGTNSYASDVIAEKERNGKLTPKSRWKNWRTVTMGEIKAVLAVIINMGVIHCPEHKGRHPGKLYSLFMMSCQGTCLRRCFGCCIFQK